MIKAENQIIIDDVRFIPIVGDKPCEECIFNECDLCNIAVCSSWERTDGQECIWIRKDSK